MFSNTVVLVLLALYLCGCSFSTAKAADQWPLRYSKEGGTYKQLNEDGSGCLSGATQALGAVTLLTLGLATPFVVAGANSSVDLDDHAACMQAKGYTVRFDANDKKTVSKPISWQRSDEAPSVAPAARPPSPPTERVSEARPLSTPPESGSQVSASPPIVATATPQALRTPPKPDPPISAAWLTDAPWELTYRGYQVSLRISDDGRQGLTWVMVARKSSQTLVGQRGSVTVSGLDTTLQGRDVNGVRVTFLLTRAAEALRGEVLVGDDPPEAVSLKRTR